MSMLGSPLRRYLAGALALVAAASSPALAFAHGHAHAELREHSSEPQHAPTSGPEIEDADGHHAHSHGAVDASVCSRVVVGPSALPKVVIAPLLLVVLQQAKQSPRAANESPPQYGAHPPPPTRAPPGSAL